MCALTLLGYGDHLLLAIQWWLGLIAAELPAPLGHLVVTGALAPPAGGQFMARFEGLAVCSCRVADAARSGDLMGQLFSLMPRS